VSQLLAARIQRNERKDKITAETFKAIEDGYSATGYSSLWCSTKNLKGYPARFPRFDHGLIDKKSADDVQYHALLVAVGSMMNANANLKKKMGGNRELFDAFLLRWCMTNLSLEEVASQQCQGLPHVQPNGQRLDPKYWWREATPEEIAAAGQKEAGW